MDAIHSETVERDGHIYRIAIYPDDDSPNPLDDWSEMGSILSLNRRHGTFDPGGVVSAIEDNPDAVPLSYHEHGQCRWSVTGELPAGCRCPFDSVSFAGVWLPDAQTLASARHYGYRTRQLFMRQRAHQACEVYSLWCNGEIYGFEISRIADCGECHGVRLEPLDACWGLFGLEACRIEARAALGAQAERAA